MQIAMTLKNYGIYNSRFSKVHLVPMNSIDKLEFLRDIFDLNETEIKFLQKNFKKKTLLIQQLQ